MIEPPCVLLHLLHVPAHRLDAHGAHLPGRLALHPAPHLLALHERDVGAEPLREHVDQLAAVLVLLGRHVGEHLGAAGVFLPQVMGEVGVNTAVLLLAGDGKGEQVAFGQFREVAHGPAIRARHSAVKMRVQ